MNRSMNALTPKEKINLAQWAYIIRDCRASGQTVKAWWQEYQIPIGKYYYWLSKLRNAALESTDFSSNPCPAEAISSFVDVQPLIAKEDEPIAYLTHQKHGRTRGKTAALQSAYREQLSFLFNEAEVTEAKAKAEEENTVTVAATFLQGYGGFLQCDSYSGYRQVKGVRKQAACWAHLRRKYVEALPRGKIEGDSLAGEALQKINELFRWEKGWQDLSAIYPNMRTNRREQPKAICT